MSATLRPERRRSDGKLPVIEIFGPTVQGEGQLCGSQSHFIRFGGCDYRCTWCDSMHAVDPVAVHKNAEWLSPRELADKVKALPPSPTVTFSGGNPALWDLNPLIDLLDKHFFINVETQGSIWQNWFERVDLLTVSPKGPSSGMHDQLDWELLRRFDDLDNAVKHNYRTVDVIFKVVIFTREDFEFAKQLRTRFTDISMFLSAGTPPDNVGGEDLIDSILNSYRNLVDMTLADPKMCSATVLPQLHQLIWPGQQGK